MIMTKTISLILGAVFCFLTLPQQSDAHSGRTDKNGGHWDRKKGTYHFHSNPKTDVAKVNRSRAKARAKHLVKK
jgi:hypothetical protein